MYTTADKTSSTTPERNGRMATPHCTAPHRMASINRLFSWKCMQAYHCSPYQHPQQPSASVTYAPFYLTRAMFQWIPCISYSISNFAFHDDDFRCFGIIKINEEANVQSHAVLVTFFTWEVPWVFNCILICFVSLDVQKTGFYCNSPKSCIYGKIFIYFKKHCSVL